MRLIICAGGTGGGVYPALAVLQALNRNHEDIKSMWVGTAGGMEADLVRREGITFSSIPAAGLHGIGLASLPQNIVLLARGFLASRKIVADFRPDAIFFTGGYVAGPMAMAARAIPKMLYVPDIEPGLALKVLARFADRIAVTSSISERYFSKPVISSGYPVRSSLTGWTREQGRAALKLRDDLPVLLIAGGSKGAHSLNLAVSSNLARLLELTQVVHITGHADWDAVPSTTPHLSGDLVERYRPFAYLHTEMGAALAAADLAVMRAGASVLGELPQLGLPAILVPYPHAWRYQKINANYLAERGAAIVIDDGHLNLELVMMVQDLLGNEAKRKAMQSAMRALAHPEAAQLLAGHLMELGGQRP